MPRRKRGNEPGWGSVLGGLALAVAVSQAKRKQGDGRSRTQQAFHRDVVNADDLIPQPLPYGSFTPSSLWAQQLEELAALVYTRLGYRNVKHTGSHSSTDGGVDVWMLNERGDVEIVQCKQFQNRVDRGELVEFSKVMRQQHAERGHFWAPNGFTKPAIEYSFEVGNIDTYIEYDIIGLVKKVYVPEIDDQLHRAQIVAQQAIPTTRIVKPRRSSMSPWQACVLVGLGITFGVLLCLGVAYVVATVN